MKTGAVTIAPSPPESKTDDRLKDSPGDGGHIRCPRCGWRPGSEDRWGCFCGHDWNTFDTGGVCPACMKQWQQTQCLACHQWSPHSDWYPKG